MNRILVVGLVAALAVAVGQPAAAGTGAETTPTFAKDVAPILFENCVVCHRPGEVAPMPLLSYEQVRPWARAIKDKVVAREMPPWHADNSVTRFAYRNDRSLTQQQIATIAAWADGGAPRGADSDMPSAPDFSSGWQVGSQPDFVFTMPMAFEVPSEGELDNQTFYMQAPWAEDKFVEILEKRPGNPSVVHHSGAHIVRIPEGWTVRENGRSYDADGQLVSRRLESESSRDLGLVAGASKLISYVPGRGVERHRPGVAKRISARGWVQFNMHYQPTGRPETDRSQLGVWFSKVPVTHEVLTTQAGNALATASDRTSLYIVEGRELKGARIPVIPPHADNWEIIGVTPVTEPITLYALSPHMHLRGKDLTWKIIWPDGREEVILSVPTYDFNWQIHYELEEPLKIPAGSKILGIGHYDNSINNRYNPAPDKEVYWAEQSWDEMYQAFMEISIDSQDLSRKKPSTE